MLSLEICETCKLPLSISPIWKISDRARICGRCLQFNTIYPNYIRDVEYEDNASTLNFKCRYSNLGCEEMLEFDAKDHESTCCMNCASVENPSKLEQQHSLPHHKFGGVLENSMLSLETLDRDIHHWYVYNLFPLTFFLHTGIISNRLIFDIGLVDKKNIANDIKYRIIVGGQSGTENFLTLAQSTVSANMKYFPDIYGPNTINYDTVVDLMGHIDIYWHVHISVPKYIFQDKFINLTAITCPKCNVSMTPPIYKCVAAHVICEDCADEKDGVGWCYACPQVKMRFPNNLKNNSKLQQIQRHNKQRVCLSRSVSMDNISRWVSPLPCRWPSFGGVITTEHWRILKNICRRIIRINCYFQLEKLALMGKKIIKDSLLYPTEIYLQLVCPEHHLEQNYMFVIRRHKFLSNQNTTVRSPFIILMILLLIPKCLLYHSTKNLIYLKNI